MIVNPLRQVQFSFLYHFISSINSPGPFSFFLPFPFQFLFLNGHQVGVLFAPTRCPPFDFSSTRGPRLRLRIFTVLFLVVGLWYTGVSIAILEMGNAYCTVPHRHYRIPITLRASINAAVIHILYGGEKPSTQPNPHADMVEYVVKCCYGNYNIRPRDSPFLIGGQPKPPI